MLKNAALSVFENHSCPSRGIYWWSEIKASSTEEVQISWPQCQGPCHLNIPLSFPFILPSNHMGPSHQASGFLMPCFYWMCLFVFSTGKIRCLSFKTVSDSSVVLPDWPVEKLSPVYQVLCLPHLFSCTDPLNPYGLFLCFSSRTISRSSSQALCLGHTAH